MRRRRTFACLVLIVCLSAVQAWAWTLPGTGQSKCYDGSNAVVACNATGGAYSGQDAAYNSSRQTYYLSPNSTITDLNTGLVWQQSTNTTGANFDAAATYCTNLRQGGYSDWRMPTLREFKLILNYSTSSPACNSTLACSTNSHWTSTLDATQQTYAWILSPLNGDVVDTVKTGSYAVRCVRGDASPLGSFQSGSDGTATDATTGLMWMTSGGNKSTWSGALTYCNDLSLAGYTDWRLPSMNEVSTIVNYATMSPALYAPLAMSATVTYDWSSTTRNSGPVLAWSHGLNVGTILAQNKGTQLGIRCVRGGVASSAPPTVSLSGAPSGSTTATTATITVGGSGTTHYRSMLDSGWYGPLTAVATPISLSGLAVGAHTLTVYGYNSAGGIAQNAMTASWTVSAPAPQPSTTVSSLNEWGAVGLGLGLAILGWSFSARRGARR